MKTTSFPLQHLLIQLEQAGFQLDPARQMRIQEVLLKLGSQYLDDPSGLTQILTPLIAQNEAEQAAVSQIVEQYLEETSFVEVPASAERPNPEDEIKRSLRRKKTMAYVAAGIMFLMLLGIFKSIQKNNSPTDILGELNFSTPGKFIFKQKRTKIQSYPQMAEEASISHFPPLQEANFMTLPVNEEGRAAIRFVSITLFMNHKTEMNWQFFKDGKLISEAEGKTVVFSQEQLGSYEVLATLYYPNGPPEVKAENRSSFLLLPPKTSANELAAKNLIILEKRQRNTKFNLFFLSVLLIILVEGVMKLWEKQSYRLHFQREFLASDEGEYALPHADTDIKLEAEPAFFDLAQSMAQRQSGIHTSLDIPSTLYATVRSGGLPSLKYNTQKVDTEYLVLIDENEPNRPAASLFGQLVKMLQAESVAIRSYTFRNDPRDCYNEKGDPWELDALARKYPKHKLLVFSKGSYMVEPNSNKLAAWVNQAFAAWETKVLISPEPPKSWYKREDALSLCFSLVAADMQGQLGLVEALQNSGLSVEENLKQTELIRQSAHISLDNYQLEQVDELEAYLGEATFKWLTAISLAPDMRWEMILRVGKAIRADQAVEEASLQYDALMKLSQLPFIQEGQMPVALQSALMQRMDQETETKVRQAILSVLKENEASSPNLANKVQQTVQEAALEPTNTSLQSKMRFLFQEGWLDKYHSGAWQQTFRLPWWQRLSWLTLLSGVTIIGFGGINVQKLMSELPHYSNEVLLEKHLSTQTLGLGEQGEEIRSIAELENQIAVFAAKTDPSHQEALVWMQALAHLSSERESEDNPYLRKILTQAGHTYYFEATNLQKDLGSIYRWFQ